MSELLSISEAARLMGVCENTLRDWDIENKFKAQKTVGGHRRYPLDQIRQYLTEHEKEEKPYNSVVNSDVHREILKKWIDTEYLENVPEKEQMTLAVILDNCKLFHNRITVDNCKLFLNRAAAQNEPILSSNQIVWLCKEGWTRSKFKKMVSVQPMTGPCVLAPYLHRTKNRIAVESKAVASECSKYNFAIFGNTNFDDVKDAYANAIAEDLDSSIFEKLPRFNTQTMNDLAKNDLMLPDCDYLIGGKELIDTLKKMSGTEKIDFFEYRTGVDPKTFDFYCCAGKYPDSKLTLPIFLPYVLVSEISKTHINRSTLMIRSGWLTDKSAS